MTLYHKLLLKHHSETRQVFPTASYWETLLETFSSFQIRFINDLFIDTYYCAKTVFCLGYMQVECEPEY